MKYGAGLRPEVARLLGEPSPQLKEEQWTASIRAGQNDLEKNSGHKLWLMRIGLRSKNAENLAEI